MSASAPAGRKKTVEVTVVGLLTLLFGGANAILGGWLINVGLILGAGAAMTSITAPATQGVGAGFGDVFSSLSAAVGEGAKWCGALALLLGLLMILAGVGALLRARWARLLTLILAVLATLVALSTLEVAVFVGIGPAYIAFSAAQALFGILALLVLVKRRAELS